MLQLLLIIGNLMVWYLASDSYLLCSRQWLRSSKSQYILTVINCMVINGYSNYSSLNIINPTVMNFNDAFKCFHSIMPIF